MISFRHSLLNHLPWRIQSFLGFRPKSSLTIKDYFKKESQPNLTKEFYKSVLPSTSIALKKAIPFTQKTHRHYEEINLKEVDEVLFFGLKNAKYIQHIWVPTFITKDNQVLSDANKDPKKGRSLHPIFTIQDMGLPQKITGKSLVLCTDGCHNGYFHWICRLLPKLWVLEKENIHIKDFDYIVVNGPEMKFKSETLSLLGIAKDKIIYTEPEKLYEFEYLLGISNIRYHQEGISFMRNKLLSTPVSEGHRKIYVTRKKANHRKIINEKRLIDLLQSKGFEIIDFADYSIPEQAKIVSETKILITIHGAGLANLIFASPKMKLIEILEDTFVNVNYWFYSNLMNVQYHYYTGKAIPSEYSKTKNRYGYDDIQLSDDFYRQVKIFLK